MTESWAVVDDAVCEDAAAEDVEPAEDAAPEDAVPEDVELEDDDVLDEEVGAVEEVVDEVPAVDCDDWGAVATLTVALPRSVGRPPGPEAQLLAYCPTKYPAKIANTDTTTRVSPSDSRSRKRLFGSSISVSSIISSRVFLARFSFARLFRVRVCPP